MGPLDDEKKALIFLIKIMLAGSVMGIFLGLAMRIPAYAHILNAESVLLNAVGLTALIGTCVFVYAAALLFLRVREFRGVFKWIRKG